MKLLQIPFSHNSIKARRALELKGVAFETKDVNPVFRRGVRRVSGQLLLPVLVDDGRAIADSTAILLYLEEKYPEPPLLPGDPRDRAECLVLEQWADATFMALTRRLAYWNGMQTGLPPGDLFFPRAPKLLRRIADRPLAFLIRRRFKMSAARNRRDEEKARRLAKLADERLGGRDHLVGETTTIADVALAAMVLPLQLAGPSVREDEHVRRLTRWAAGILDFDYSALARAAASASSGSV
jgi:glutathione S-transferase